MGKNIGRTEVPAAGQSLVAPIEAAATHGSRHSKVPVRPIFFLASHPARWGIIDGRLLPLLSVIPLVPGVLGVQMDGPRVRSSALRANLEESGWTLIPHNAAPNGVSYVQAIETSVGGRITTTHITIFETAYPQDSRTVPDQTAYCDWVASLIGSFIDPVSPPVIRRLIAKAEKSGDTVALALLRKAELAVRRPITGAVAVVE